VKTAVTRGLLAAAGSLGACLALALPTAAAHPPPSGFAASNSVFAGTTISLKHGEAPEILDRVVLAGRIPIPGPNQPVSVVVSREGEHLLTRELPTDPVSGRFQLKLKLTGCCRYTAQASHGTDVSDPYGFEVHGPATLRPGPQTLLFNQLLQKAGYHMGDVSDQVDDSTGLAILALRKVNEFPLSEDYAPSLFTLLLSGRGRFQPEHTEDGRHVEVDLSRQVMALVEDGRATDVFHVSTGAFGTPTGDFHFYEKSPGYNAKGMYYSVYYSGNYATHGYYTVPYYPASHGCVRNPEAYSTFIYGWITLGDPMYIYE
jgi:hypothetical protein